MELESRQISDGRTAAPRKRFYILLSLLLGCCFADYVFALHLPQLVFLAVAFAIAATGDSDEIAALCICCVPLHTYVEFAFIVLFGILCHAVKSAGSIRIRRCILPVGLMILWELLHCFMPGLNVMQLGGHFVLWLLLAVFMCSDGHAFDYRFIIQAFVITTAVMCCMLLCRLLYSAGWSLSWMMLNLQRLGMSEEFGVSKVNPNSLGIMCIFGVCGLLQMRYAGRKVPLDVAFTIALLLFGVMTASKTFLICLLFMAFLFVLAMKGSARQKLRFAACVVAVGLVVLAISYIVMPDLLKYYISRFFEKDFTTGRIDTMGEYHRFLLANWDVLLCGIGLQGFSERVLQMCPQAVFVPHNGLQELILAWGIPGIALFVALWLAMSHQSRKQCRRQSLINYIPLLVLLLKTMAGQMLNSSYTMLMFSFVYLSMCADLSGEPAPQPLTPDRGAAVAVEDGIPLQRAAACLWRGKFRLAAIAMAGAVAAFGVTKGFITPRYDASVLMYISNGSISVGNVAEALSSGDIVASRSLVSTYRVILRSRQTLNEVIRLSGVDSSYEDVLEMITAESANGTEVMKVVVSHPDPATAERLANAVAEVLPGRIAEIIDGASTKVIDYAVAAPYPSSPSTAINTAIGFLSGFMVGAMLLLLQAMRRTRINARELATLYPYPVLAAIPDLTDKRSRPD